MATSTPVTGAMLAGGEIGIVFTDATTSDSFNIVFSVSDGNLDSFPSVATITLVDTLPTEVPEAVPRIALGSMLGPALTIDNGFATGSLQVPTTEQVTNWREGTSDAGVYDTLDGDAWTYTETYDAGPTDEFGVSLVYVFIAAGVGEALTSYTVTLTGKDEGSIPGTDIADLPTGAPAPSDEPNSLTYTLDVSIASDGTVASSMISGRSHVSYFDAIVDEPYTSSTETSEGSSSHDGSGVYKIIIAGWSTLIFDSTGTNINARDVVFYTYSGSGTYGPAPVTGTYTASGSLDASTTINGRILIDGTPVPLTLVDSWRDESTFSYVGGGNYTEEGVTYTVIENGSDTFLDQGTVTVSLAGEDFTIEGDFTIAAFGNHFYDNRWTGPLEVEDETSSITGTLSGSVRLVSSYDDFIEFEIGLIEPEPSDPDQTSTPEDAEPTYGWLLVGGTFNDSSLYKVESSYSGSGTYSTTGGSGLVKGGDDEELDTPITGTISIGGKSKSSIDYHAAGTFDHEDVTIDTGSLNLHDSADSSVLINATGTINSAGLTGTIVIDDRFETDTLRDLTFDLTDPELPATGFGHDYVLVDSTYDQDAIGTKTFDGMTGSQWANIYDRAFTEIDVQYIWNDAKVEESEDDERVGWEATSFAFTILNNMTSDLGYDVSGTVTRDGMTGTATDYARDQSSDFLSIDITSGTTTEPEFEFNSLVTFDFEIRTSEELTGTVSETLEPAGAELTLNIHRTTRDESHVYLSISASTDAEGEVTAEGFYSIDTNQFKDTGRSGSGTYTRVDGDTTFTGTASLTESTIIDTGVFLLFSLDEEGQWQLGASRPNVDFATGLMYSDVTITFDTRYDSTSGDVDGEDGPTHWTGTASESGFANFSLISQVTGVPSPAPPATSTEPSSEPSKDDDAGGLPELVWTYTGTLDIGSLAGGAAERDSSGVYDSGTLTGSLTEIYRVESRVIHDEFHNLSPEGEWVQDSGENRATASSTFTSSQDLSGTIGSDNENAAGLTGMVNVKSNAGGGSDYLRVDTFTPAVPASGTETPDPWTSTGNREQYINQSSLIDVNLSGTVDSGSMSLAVTYGMQSHSAGYVLEKHELVPAADPGEYEWQQYVGAEGNRSTTSSNSSSNGSNAEGYQNETTRNRDETSTWRRYVPMTDSWTDGGFASEDYFMSSNTGSSQSEPQSIPIGGTTSTGNSSSSSSQLMVTDSRTGKVIGSSATAPDDPNGPDLSKITLPTALSEVGTAGAGGPIGGVIIVPGTDYGVLSMNNSGGNSSGFNVSGSYTVDSGGSSPATATRNMSGSASSSYGFMLVSALDTASGQWKNTAGTSSTSSSNSQNDTFNIQGDWGIDDFMFVLSGTFTSLQANSNSTSQSTASTLNPATGQWLDTSSSGYLWNVTRNQNVSGTGSYSYDDWGFIVSGPVVMIYQDNFTEHQTVNKDFENGSLAATSNGVGFTEHTTVEKFEVDGSGSRHVANQLPGDPGGTWNTTSDVSLVEKYHYNVNSLDHTDERFDMTTGSLIPSIRRDFYDSTLVTGGELTSDALVEFLWEEEGVDGDYGWEIHGESRSRNKLVREHKNTAFSKRDIVYSLESPLAEEGVGGSVSGQSGHYTMTHDKEDLSDFRNRYWSNGGYEYEDYYYSNTNSIKMDSVEWSDRAGVAVDGQPINDVIRRYFGSIATGGDDFHYWVKQNGVFVFNTHIPFAPYAGPTSYDVSTSNHDVVLPGNPPTTIPSAYNDSFGRGEINYAFIEAPHREGSGIAATVVAGRPAVPAGVAELQTATHNAAAANDAANAARDQTFTDLAQDAEALGQDDSESTPKTLLTVIRPASNTDQPNMIALVSEVDGERQSLGDTGGRGDLCQRFPGSCNTPPTPEPQDDVPKQRFDWIDRNFGGGNFGDPDWSGKAISWIMEGLGYVPIAGQIKDGVQAATGVGNNGEDLNALDRGAALAGLIPGGKIVQGGGAFVKGMVGSAAGAVVKHADEAADAAKAATKAPKGELYDVGRAMDLRKNPVKGTQVNHAPQTREAELLVGGHSKVNKVGHEPSIRLPIDEHDAISAAQRARGATGSARDLLAEEIRDLRNLTNALNSKLQDLIKLNKETHPYDYLPLHRMESP